jgi:hypothetical protein
MVRSFTVAAAAASFVSFFIVLTPSVAPAQPGKGGSQRVDVPRPDAPRKDEPRQTFPVPAAPAPDGFVYGTIDWQGVLADVRNEKLGRTGGLPNGAIVQENGVTPTLPVLLPAEPALLSSVQVQLEPNSYSASGDIGRANVTIYGTHVFRNRAANDPIARAAAAAPRETLSNGVVVRVTTAEAGINLTFVRWGAAYLISIECANSDTDKRCSRPAFIKSLAEKMAIAG